MIYKLVVLIWGFEKVENLELQFAKISFSIFQYTILHYYYGLLKKFELRL
jgi:hypothetical protein